MVLELVTTMVSKMNGIVTDVPYTVYQHKLWHNGSFTLIPVAGHICKIFNVTARIRI